MTAEPINKPGRDHGAIYQRRVARAKAAGYASFHDMRTNRRPPAVAIRARLETVNCKGAAEVARLAVEALQDEGWLR